MIFKRTIPATCLGFTLIVSCFIVRPLAAAESDFRYAQEGSGVYIFGYTGPSGHVEIPPTIGGKTVIRIHDGAFRNRSDLTSVTIPIGVTDIGDNSFWGCSGLNVVSFQSPSSVARIGYGAFSGCTSLGGVEIPSSVVTIDSYAFYGCTALTTLKLSNGASNIGHYSFAYCTSIEDLSFPPSVVSIGDGSFSGCNGLKDLVVPVTVTALGAYAFYDCDGLISAKILANISIISDALFWDCNNLKHVDIPSSVTTIDTKAFLDCGSLICVKIPSGVTSFGDNAFRRCSSIKHFAFMGGFPTLGYNSLGELPNGCLMYYFDGAIGFPLPEYLGFVSINMGAITPVKTWLVDNCLPYNSNLQDDSNGDGVNLLMAYALNLDPKQNLSGSLPKPEYTANQMKLRFYAGSEGIAYSAQSSTDLKSWSVIGLSAPDASGYRTATVSSTDPRRFMRLVFSQ